jgi:glycosyltransferase involved in cell wall biosynthesis
MKVLIWFPLNVKGGGARLFVNLVSALSKHREVELIKIVLSDDCKNNEYFEGLKKIGSVNIYYYPGDMNSFLKKGKEKIDELEAELAELRREATATETNISGIKKTISNLEHEIVDINIPDIFNIRGRTFFQKIGDAIYKKIFFKEIMFNYMNIVNSIKNKIKIKQDEMDKLELKLTNILKTIEQLEKKLNEIVQEESAPVDYYGNDCDVVYFFWLHFIEFQKTKKPSVCTFQDVVILDFPENVGGNNARAFWEASKKWIENTTCVVTSSNYVKERLRNYYGEVCDSIMVIPHSGSPVEYFSGSEIDAESILKKYKLPKDYILYPGNLSFHKNHYNLIVAYSYFKYREKYPLVLCGFLTEFLRNIPPDYPDLINCARLVALINRLGLKHEKDYYALGYIDDRDVEILIKKAKILVMPSLSEGGGSYPVEEALRMGVPVACSDIPVMREHLANRTALIRWFNPELPDSIAEAMNDMIKNYEKYKESTIKGMNDIVKDWNEIAENYIRVFKIAIERFYNKKLI